jgi:hypothetical protein
MTANWFSGPAPVVGRMRAYFAAVNRATGTPVMFDASQQAVFDLDAPPSPWMDLGPIQGFTRSSNGKMSAIITGIPAAALEQTRNLLDARVSFEFVSWTKLTMGLATGSQHMNLLAPAGGAPVAPDGGVAAPAVAVQAGSTATAVRLTAADAVKFAAGSIIVVDGDYTGQTGFVGVPIAGAYVRQPLNDADYIRRITFNAGLVTQVSGTTLTLAKPLPGGAPAIGSKVQAITGFVDREGGSFYQEWSALFVAAGAQGDRIIFHYPRLQSMAGAEEGAELLDAKHKGGLSRSLLRGQFIALPVIDPMDGERVLCYRSFIPAPNSLV